VVAFSELLNAEPSRVTPRLLIVVLAGIDALNVDPAVDEPAFMGVDVEKVPCVPLETAPVWSVYTVLSAVDVFPAHVLEAEFVNSSPVSFIQKEAVDVPDPAA
jgi:hypothetical protein